MLALIIQKQQQGTCFDWRPPPHRTVPKVVCLQFYIQNDQLQ